MGNLQTGFDPKAGMQGTGFFSNPLQGEGGLSKLLNKTKAPTTVGGTGATEASSVLGNNPRELGLIKNIEQQGQTGGILKTMKNLMLDNKLLTGLAAGTLGATALMGNMEPEEIQDLQRGEGLDVEGIRAEVIEAYKDSSGQKLAALRNKYPYLGTQASKDIANMAMGGRIGFSEGTDSMTFGILSDNQDISKEINQKVIEYENEYMQKTGNVPPEFYGEKYRMKLMKEFMDQNKAEGGRIKRAEGGIMDLGGMEKDYRNTGGFVDIGEYEKKDDVPARLSVNEFVMTADAVRGMGDGNIDLGAKRMENLMGAMENKKGAQQMFDVSERLSEVV